MATTSLDYQVVPTSTSPMQNINVTLGGQSCRIRLFTKSINVPIVPPGSIETDPNPVYENTNPVFLDLYVNDALIVGGVICRSNTRLVRDAYLGFVGDLAVMDTLGRDDPQGVPLRLPPYDLRNWWQRTIPLATNGLAPSQLANTIPGLGTRWLLTYWPNLR